MDGTAQQVPLALPRSLSTWQAAGGTVFTWVPSPATLTHVTKSPKQDIPPSFQQEQHLRSFRSHHQNGLEMERLLILTWELPGQCNLTAMSEAINIHLRRHDTYHSWYSFEQDNRVTRRVIPEPSLIEFVASPHGEMSWEQVLQEILATPTPLQWDCFRFGVIQRADDFSCYASIDHLHSDAFLIPVVFRELYGVYRSTIEKEFSLEMLQPSSYIDFCRKQRQDANSLSLDDAKVHGWINFLKTNQGALPRFPLTLGDTTISRSSNLITINLMDEQESFHFETTCSSSNATFFAGIIACMAIAENKLLCTDAFHAITPTTTRKTLRELSTGGWYTGVVPLNFQVAGLEFSTIVRSVHELFRSRRHLAKVPIERVIELSAELATINISDSGGVMISYLDTNMPPIKHDLLGEFERLVGQVFINSGASKNVAIWVTKSRQGATLSVSHPDNPVAAQSVAEYSKLLQSVCLQVSQ